MSIYHEVHGTGNSGATILMSSGLGGSANYWKPQVNVLLENGYKVIVYDHLGTGRSRPAKKPASYSIASMATDVLEILDVTHTDRCHFVGHALGGLVGLQLALDAPSRISSLVLINAWSKMNSHTERCFQARLTLLEARGVTAYVEAQPIFLYPGSWAVENSEAIAEEVAHAIAHFPGEQTMRTRIQALMDFDVGENLQRINIPCLVSATIDDVLVPWTQSRKLAQGLPNSTVEYVPQGGHAYNITEANVFNQSLLNFLKQQVT